MASHTRFNSSVGVWKKGENKTEKKKHKKKTLRLFSLHPFFSCFALTRDRCFFYFALRAVAAGGSSLPPFYSIFLERATARTTGAEGGRRGECIYAGLSLERQGKGGGMGGIGRDWDGVVGLQG